MARWDEFLTEQDRQVFAAAGYTRATGFGQRPVVLVVDVNYAFCGDRPLPILESIKTWRNSCGEQAWLGIAHIETLLGAARAKRLPIIYTTSQPRSRNTFDRGRWMDKNPRSGEDVGNDRGRTIVPAIAPRPQDIVIEKGKPSAFFATLLAAYLADLSADSLIVCGGTTSGCVRATVVDGFSYNYRMSVVEECTFDRGQASHAMNLFDLNAKYADVVGLPQVLDFVASLPDDLFLADMPALAWDDPVAAPSGKA